MSLGLRGRSPTRHITVKNLTLSMVLVNLQAVWLSDRRSISSQHTVAIEHGAERVTGE